MIVISSGLTPTLRDLIIALAARHQLPAIYSIRPFVTNGGLMSFGADGVEPYRLAPGYVDRILHGEKPGDLPSRRPARRSRANPTMRAMRTAA
jgi:putative ABC transport system substrate-binding protein